MIDSIGANLRSLNVLQGKNGYCANIFIEISQPDFDILLEDFYTFNN